MAYRAIRPTSVIPTSGVTIGTPSTFVRSARNNQPCGSRSAYRPPQGAPAANHTGLVRPAHPTRSTPPKGSSILTSVGATCRRGSARLDRHLRSSTHAVNVGPGRAFLTVAETHDPPGCDTAPQSGDLLSRCGKSLA